MPILNGMPLMRSGNRELGAVQGRLQTMTTRAAYSLRRLKAHELRMQTLREPDRRNRL